jgi:hypothetical protein
VGGEKERAMQGLFGVPRAFVRNPRPKIVDSALPPRRKGSRARILLIPKYIVVSDSHMMMLKEGRLKKAYSMLIEFGSGNESKLLSMLEVRGE